MDSNPSQENLERIIRFLDKIKNLKFDQRYGEAKKMPKNLKDSIASHSWRLVLMVSVLIDELNLNVNKERALEIAVIHDIAESIVGDIDAVSIFTGKVTREDKQERERAAMRKIKESLPLRIGDKISELWYEYEEGSTKEAKLVKALDKLETMIHLVESGHESWHEPEFIVNYANKTVHNFPELKGLLKIVKQKLKEEFNKGNIPWKEEYDS